MVLLRTERTPLRALVRALYLAIARAAGAYLTRGETRPAVYVRAGLGAGEFVPGRSDVDLAIVVATDTRCPGGASARVRRRWERLDRALPKTGRLLDEPRAYDEAELRDIVGSSALTYGLEGTGENRAALVDEASTIDTQWMLHRPGLYGATADWRLLSGPDRRPVEPPRSAQERRIAAWLELVCRWRWTLNACANLGAPATPSNWVKRIAEPARIWLWLAHGERLGTRAEVLRRALQRLPEEEHMIRLALALQRSQREPEASLLGDLLPLLLRLSARIDRLIADQITPAGATEVRLVGHAVGEFGGRLPLCDWRSLATPSLPDESFALRDDDPGDPAALGAATRSQSGPRYVALQRDGLLVLPARFGERSLGRAIKSEATDPVSFALANGSSVARFPNVRGWSAQDTARRAVAEHRAWLRRPPTPLPLWMLLSAARAALFLESVRQGEAELSPTLRGAAELLAARFPESAVREAVRSDAVEAVRTIVLRLPAYSPS